MLLDQKEAVRASLTCVNCLEDKPAGLMLCWPCHHSQKHHNDGGYSKRVERLLERQEALLKARK